MRIVGITGGVDTHADTHVAAAVDHNGGCWVSNRSRRPRPDVRTCWPGWSGSVNWSGLGLRAPGRGVSD